MIAKPIKGRFIFQETTYIAHPWRDFLPDAGTDDIFRHAGFSQNDADGDKRKRAESPHRQQEQEQLPPQKIRVRFGQRRAAKHLRVRQLERRGQISAHGGSVAQDYPAKNIRLVFPCLAALLRRAFALNITA